MTHSPEHSYLLLNLERKRKGKKKECDYTKDWENDPLEKGRAAMERHWFNNFDTNLDGKWLMIICQIEKILKK